MGDDLAVSENVSEYRCALENLGFARAGRGLVYEELKASFTSSLKASFTSSLRPHLLVA